MEFFNNMQYINADFMQVLTKSFFSLQNGTAILHFSLQQFFTSLHMQYIQSFNMCPIRLKCNLDIRMSSSLGNKC